MKKVLAFLAALYESIAADFDLELRRMKRVTSAKNGEKTMHNMMKKGDKLVTFAKFRIRI